MPNKVTKEIEFKSNIDKLVASQNKMIASLEKMSKILTSINLAQKKHLDYTQKEYDITRKQTESLKKQTDEFKKQIGLKDKEDKRDKSSGGSSNIGNNIIDLYRGTKSNIFYPVAKIFSGISKVPDVINTGLQNRIGNIQENFTKNAKRINELNGKKELTDAEKKELADLNDEQAKLTKTGKTTVKAQGKAAAVAAIAQKVFSVINAIVIQPLSALGKQVTDVTKQMLDLKSGVATFSSSSLITNASARSTKLKYGMSDAEAYGFQQASNLLNIQSDEDLMYMNAGQREKLLQYMEKYSAWYSEMERSGVLSSIQSMQLEFQELKQELAMEFLQWIAENKDTIMSVIKGIFNVLKTIAEFVLQVLNFFSLNNSSTSPYGSDYLSNTPATKNTTINISANTTNNGSAVEIQSAEDAMWSDLAKKIVSAYE